MNYPAASSGVSQKLYKDIVFPFIGIQKPLTGVLFKFLNDTMRPAASYRELSPH